LNQTVSIPIAILLAIIGFTFQYIKNIIEIDISFVEANISSLIFLFFIFIFDAVTTIKQKTIEDDVPLIRKIFYLIPVVLIIINKNIFNKNLITNFDIKHIIYLSLLCLISWLILIELYLLFRFLMRFRYYYIPLPEYIGEYAKDLEKYYIEINEKNIKTKILEDIYQYYQNELNKSCNINYENNKQKAYILNKIKLITLVNLILIIFAMIVII
jgi:hypothetical protein